MKNFTQLLTKLRSDIMDARARPEYDDLMEALEAINEELHDGSSAEEWDIYNRCEAEALKASRFLADEYAQEERDQFADEMQYASYRSQR